MTNQLVSIVDGRPVTSSLIISEHFRKAHRTVLRKIQLLDCSMEFNQHNFVLVEYMDSKGEKRPCYKITKDGFMFLVMGFTGKEAAMWKERFINRFNEMEEKLREPVRPIQLAFNPLDRQQVAEARRAYNVFAEKGRPLESITEAEVAGYIASVMNRTLFQLYIDHNGCISLRPQENPYKGLVKAIRTSSSSDLKDDVIREIGLACTEALADRAVMRREELREGKAKIKELIDRLRSYEDGKPALELK